MAGDWIKIETELHEKPEVASLSASLHVDEFSIIGRLIRIWSWFNKHTEKGCAPGVTSAFLDRLVSLDGFSSALESVGWLTIRNGKIEVPKFDRHNSKPAKNRALSKDRMKRSRYASRATDAQPEKRREEKSKEGAYAPKKNSLCTRSQAEALYNLYPRRVSKQVAIKAIIGAVSRLADSGHDDPLAHLQDRVFAYAKSPAGQSPPGDDDYRPHPATWFNQARYEDDPSEWQRPNGGGRASERGRETALQKCVNGTPTYRDIKAAFPSASPTNDQLNAVFQGDDE